MVIQKHFLSLHSKTNFMPSIDVEIEPYEFIRGCRKTEIKELIDELVDLGHLPESVRNWQKTDENQKNFHPSEAIYESEIDKLHGKYSILTREEEETILKITSRL